MDEHMGLFDKAVGEIKRFAETGTAGDYIRRIPFDDNKYWMVLATIETVFNDIYEAGVEAGYASRVGNLDPPKGSFDPGNPLHIAVRHWALAEIEAAKVIERWNND